MKRAYEIAKEWATVHRDNDYNTLDDLEKAILEAQREVYREAINAARAECMAQDRACQRSHKHDVEARNCHDEDVNAIGNLELPKEIQP